MVTPENIEQWIAEGLSGTESIRVTGDGRHFEALIVNASFDGLSLIKRHQMVYGALGERMKEEIHALSMKTLTPEEYNQSE